MEGNLDDENVKMMNMLMMMMTMITIRMLTVPHQVVPIYPPLSSAKLEGLHEGAKLNQVIIINPTPTRIPGMIPARKRAATLSPIT